jgi:uncharacterized RDD family membrane protein YckC
MTPQPSWYRPPQQHAVKSELEYVGFWARVGAALIDTLILVIVTLPLTYIAYGQISSPQGHAFQGPVDVVINLVLPAVVVVWLWSKMQATPGEMAMSARIVDADTGGVPTLTQLVIRYVGYFVSTIPLGLGLIWVGFDRRKQGWHDKMANTVVIKPAGKEAVRFGRARDFNESKEPTL